MTLVRAPVLHCRDSTTASRLSPGLREGPPAPLAGADARRLETLHTRAAEVPRGATEDAVQRLRAEAGRRDWPFPKERRRGDQVETRRHRLAWRRTLIQRGASLKPSPLPTRGVQAAFEARCRREATGEALPTDPQGVVAIGLGPLPKERRICSAVVRIPGPDNSGRSGADTQRIDLGGSRALRHPSVTLRRRRDESQRLATAWCRGDLASWHSRKSAENDQRCRYRP